MKICPDCKAENKDSNRCCSNCQKYIGNVESTADDYSTAERQIAAVEKRLRRRKYLSLAVFLLFYLIYLGFYAYLYYDVLGSLNRWYGLLPAYIPCLLVFLFPYDWAYGKLRGLFHKEPRPLSEHATIFFKVLAWAYLFILYCETFNVLNRAAKH